MPHMMPVWLQRGFSKASQGSPVMSCRWDAGSSKSSVYLSSWGGGTLQEVGL